MLVSQTSFCGEPLLAPQNVGFSHHAYWNNDVFTEIQKADLELVFNKLMHSDVKNKQTNKHTTKKQQQPFKCM